MSVLRLPIDWSVRQINRGALRAIGGYFAVLFAIIIVVSIPISIIVTLAGITQTPAIVENTIAAVALIGGTAIYGKAALEAAQSADTPGTPSQKAATPQDVVIRFEELMANSEFDAADELVHPDSPVRLLDMTPEERAAFEQADVELNIHDAEVVERGPQRAIVKTVIEGTAFGEQAADIDRTELRKYDGEWYLWLPEEPVG